MISFFASLVLSIAAFFGYHKEPVVTAPQPVVSVQTEATLSTPTASENSITPITPATAPTPNTSTNPPSPNGQTKISINEKIVPSIIAQQKTSITLSSNAKPAFEIVNPSGFVNTNDQPITIGQFKGKKVVLVEFWTYGCINCERTLPYVNTWYDKYHDKGLEVIGIHTPEFSYEHLKSNVEAAAKKYGIKYPIVQDNDYSTWNASKNSFWPHQFLINVNGDIIYDHVGEGAYDETERQIQKALEDVK